MVIKNTSMVPNVYEIDYDRHSRCNMGGKRTVSAPAKTEHGYEVVSYIAQTKTNHHTSILKLWLGYILTVDMGDGPVVHLSLDSISSVICSLSKLLNKSRRSDGPAIPKA